MIYIIILQLNDGEHYSYLNNRARKRDAAVQQWRSSAAFYRYDEFGGDLSGNQLQFQPFGYTGYQKDMTAGTYYAQAREYDAWSGRFISEDIIKGSAAYPETLNAYGYCWGNPLKFVDRDGREPKYVPGNDYDKTMLTDENGVPIIKKKEQYFIPYDDYEELWTDPNGVKYIRRREEVGKNSDISNVDILGQSYDITIDAMSALNEACNVFEPKVIEAQLRPNNIGKGAWNKKIAKKVAEQAKFHSGVSKVLEKAGEIGVVLDGIVSVFNNIKAKTSLPKILIDLGVDLLVSVGLLTLGNVITTAITGFFAAGGTITLPGIGTVGGAAIGAILGVVVSIGVIGLLGGLLNKKNNDEKSIIDQIKDFIWDFANGEIGNGCSVNE